jgi:hypothetical protein
MEPVIPGSRTNAPVFYGDQPVPGVMAEIEQLQNGRWILTVNHVLVRDPAILAAIRPLAGLGPAQRVTSYEIGPQAVRFRIAVPQPQGGMHGMIMGGPLMIPPVFGLGAGGPPAPPVNIYAGAPHTGTRNVPANAENAILFESIAPGTEMVDFHGESGHGRYYTLDSFRQLPMKMFPGVGRFKENPQTRQPIRPANVTRYRKTGGRRRRSTRRHRRRA